MRLDPLGAERLSQAVHVDLQRADRGVRRLVAPERIDEPVAGHDAAAFEQQRREQSPLLRRAYR